MSTTTFNRGGDNNIHAQVKFNNSWIDINKDKDDNPATMTIHTMNDDGSTNLTVDNAQRLLFALDKAINIMSDLDQTGTKLSLIVRDL